jgi:uncharacterized RDD family membrane protein YckC
MPKTSRPQLAGWWRRAGAFLIDGLVIAIPSFIVARRLNGTTTERLSMHLLFMFGGIAYGAILIRAQGKTLGMRAVSIAALDLRNGRNITTGAAWLRSVVAFAFFGLTSEIADSDRIRTPVPIDSVHLFRGNPYTLSRRQLA